MKNVPVIKDFEPLIKIRKDMKEAAITLGQNEARYLVDTYYMMQENRIRADHQIRILSETKEPHAILEWLSGNTTAVERNIALALGVYSKSSEIGQWAESIVGIGPILSAGLLAHIDMQKAPTAGHIWSYAGILPDAVWLGEAGANKVFAELKTPNKLSLREFILTARRMGTSPKWLARRVYSIANGREFGFAGMTRSVDDEVYCEHVFKGMDILKKDVAFAVVKRPWNASLKTLCWKIGESFVKVHNNKNDYYGKLYVARKEYETLKNENGDYKDQAEAELEKKKYKDSDTKDAYLAGKLPVGRIHARAKRHAVKIFLSHWHAVAYEVTFQKKPPKPFVIEHLGHTHELIVPNWPLGGK